MIPKEAWCGAKNKIGVFPIRLQELIKTFGEKNVPNLPCEREKMYQQSEVK